MSLFTRMRPGEGTSVLLYALYAFLLLVCYYILKTIREALILTEFGAEARSYATAVIAILLLFIVPLYGLLFRHARKVHLIRWVTTFFIVNILLFWFMARGGVEIGFFYFVFAGIFGVMVIAQFWAFAADSYNVKSGQRLFPVIMIGASAGALAGAQFTKFLTGRGLVEPINMLLIAAGILAATLLLSEISRRSIPDESRSLDGGNEESIEEESEKKSLFGGFSLVFKDRYLLMIAGLVILLNWVNTTGETILAHFVSEHATRVAAESPGLERGDIIAGFYGDFFFWVNLVGFAMQALRNHGLHSRVQDHPVRQDHGEQHGLVHHEHDAAGALPADGPRGEVRGQDRHRHVFLEIRRPHPGRCILRRHSLPWPQHPAIRPGQPGAGAGLVGPRSAHRT